MPRTKLYATNAERQAAHRQRHKENSEASAADLATVARNLEGWINRAAELGDADAAKLKGADQLETLRNVANHFKEKAMALEYPNADAD